MTDKQVPGPIYLLPGKPPPSVLDDGYGQESPPAKVFRKLRSRTDNASGKPLGYGPRPTVVRGR